uniref:Breast carcinoma amplified sequence 1 n=1 Tax=Bos indicus x Bos taurus TaxID=30522 RepID=A0A4W2EHU8_BOBOX
MGNQMSVPQRVEDQENDPEADTHKVTSGDACGQNGLPVITSARTVQLYDEVDLGISMQEDNVAASSPKTMETSAAAEANGESLGKDAKPQAPAAKSRFFLTLSRPVPGRTGDQATDSSSGSVRLDVSSDKAPGNKDPSEPMALPVAAAPGHGPDKTPGQTPAQAEGLPATPGPEHPPSESGAAAPAKPKDSSFFDKLFKLDKGRDKAPVDLPLEAESTEHPHPAAEAPGLSKQSEDGPAERDLVDGKGKAGQEVPTVSCSVPGDPEQLEIAKEDAQAENSSIMSFFKTLVSPHKAETKKDPEDTASKGESVSDGQAGQKTSEVQAKGAKKKHLHSPRLGLAFRKFFRHKGEEKSAAPSANLKSDKANVTLQEPQGAAKNSTPTETAKEKGGPSSLPLGKLFWKKSVKEDSVPTGAEENTSDPTEKVVAPPQPEAAAAAAGQKGKEGPSKDKKAATETNKQKGNRQEAKEPALGVEPAAAEANSLPNGDKPQKRPEKRRQSLGGFFKGLVGSRGASPLGAFGPRLWVPPPKATNWLATRWPDLCQTNPERLLGARGREPGACRCVRCWRRAENRSSVLGRGQLSQLCGLRRVLARSHVSREAITAVQPGNAGPLLIAFLDWFAATVQKWPKRSRSRRDSQAARFSDRLGALMALWHRDARRDGERWVDTTSYSRHRALCLRPGFLAFVTSLMMATSLWGRNASSLIPPSSCCHETPTVVKKGGLSCHFARIQSSPEGFQAGHVSPGVA